MTGRASDGQRAGTKRLLVAYVHRGHPQEVEVEVPETGESEEQQRKEVSHFVQTLADNHQLDGPGATHEIVSTPDGTRRLRRRRFTLS